LLFWRCPAGVRVSLVRTPVGSAPFRGHLPAPLRHRTHPLFPFLPASIEEKGEGCRATWYVAGGQGGAHSRSPALPPARVLSPPRRDAISLYIPPARAAGGSRKTVPTTHPVYPFFLASIEEEGEGCRATWYVAGGAGRGSLPVAGFAPCAGAFPTPARCHLALHPAGLAAGGKTEALKGPKNGAEGAGRLSSPGSASRSR